MTPSGRHAVEMEENSSKEGQRRAAGGGKSHGSGGGSGKDLGRESPPGTMVAVHSPGGLKQSEKATKVAKKMKSYKKWATKKHAYESTRTFHTRVKN